MMFQAPHIILASVSPRRAQLLEQLHVTYEVFPVDIDEAHRPPEVVEDYVARLARCKAQSAHKQMKGRSVPVLAADTAISLDGEIMGKPTDRKDAARMLASLSGKLHKVLTGVVLLTDVGEDIRVDCSTVKFADIGLDEIEAYLDIGEHQNKAGAYAIQGYAAVFIERLEGSYSGVMGLPLFVVAQMLKRSVLLRGAQ